MILYALTQTFASIDWIMSLEPHWFSTMFGVHFFAASCCGFFAMAILACWVLQRAGRVTESITTEHFHDLGKGLFAFGIAFWAYITFSQFMLIWYANLPEETGWFMHRMHGYWLPISIFLLRAYVLSIPQDVDDAAFMDGANPFQTFLHVILPLMRPGLITVAIIVFLNSWNEFLITSTFQKGRSNITMTLGYLSMNGTYATDQGALMAGAFILVAPIIVFFLLLQRFFISGMTSGAVKG